MVVVDFGKIGVGRLLTGINVMLSDVVGCTFAFANGFITFIFFNING